MRSTEHSWKKARKPFGQRFFFGLMVAGTLSLVAFEWKSPREELKIITGLPDEGLEPEVLPVVILEKPKAAAPAKKTRSTQVVVGEQDPVVVPSPESTPEPEPGPGTEPTPDPDPRSLLPPETVDPGPVLWGNVKGVRPYFMDCLKRNHEDLEPCTEARIDAHLQRHMRIPASVRGQVRTTVTFEIDAKGRIGKIVCAPKVSDEVRAEIERVIRSMPEFVPGSQGGYPVPVYYQLPLSLRNR
jgi:hypothetical protein